MRLFLSLLFCLAPAMAQTSIPITNASFSNYNTLGYGCGSGCAYNFGPIPGWTMVSGTVGSFQPGTAEYPSGSIPGGSVIAFTNTGEFSQDLGVTAAPETNYTLSVYMCNRADGNFSTSDTMTLLIGSTTLASQTINTSTITGGTCVQETISGATESTVPSGDLIIQLSSSGSQGNFSTVSLTYVQTQLTVELTWNWPTTYNVFRATSSQGASCPPTSSTSYTQIATNVTANPTNTWADTTVMAGQTYCYYAIVSVAGYASTPSKTVQVTVP